MDAFSGFIEKARCFTPTAIQRAVLDKQKSYFHVYIDNSLVLWYSAQILIHLPSTPVMGTHFYIYMYVKSSLKLEYEVPVVELADTAVFIFYIILTLLAM